MRVRETVYEEALENQCKPWALKVVTVSWGFQQKRVQKARLTQRVRRDFLMTPCSISAQSEAAEATAAPPSARVSSRPQPLRE